MNKIRVGAYERSKPDKPREYIATHMALFRRRSDAIMFAQRHGVMVVSTEDARLHAPIPEAAHGGRISLAQITSQLKQLVGRRS